MMEWNIVTIFAVFGGVLLLLEFVVPGAVLGFLGLAAFIVAGLMYLGIIVSPIHAIISFFMISIFLVLFLRSFALRIMPGEFSIENTDEDADAIGSFVDVIEEIKPESLGRVRFRDSTWEAESEFKIGVNEKAIIIARRGNRWIVKPI